MFKKMKAPSSTRVSTSFLLSSSAVPFLPFAREEGAAPILVPIFVQGTQRVEVQVSLI